MLQYGVRFIVQAQASVSDLQHCICLVHDIKKVHIEAKRVHLAGLFDMKIVILPRKHKILLDDYKVRPELNKHKNI